MACPIRQLIACTLLVLGVAVPTYSQTTPAKEPTASISGKVTFKGKAIAGIVVAATLERYNDSPSRSRHRDTTDQDGNYRITKLRPGTYHVRPVAPALIVEDEQSHKSLMISEGESVEDINFSLVRGGVVTGRVTDAEGQPLVEQHVSLLPVDSQSGNVPLFDTNPTDDRGIYRLFGLRAGKYKVSVGQSDHQLPGYEHQVYKQTFHPSVNDSAKATVIEVTEGGETKDVDIVVGRSVNTFKVSGRIVDGETGKPLPNIEYGMAQITSGGSSATSGYHSNQNGQFTFQNVIPGKYSVFIVPQADSDMRADPVSLEVVDGDVSEVLIKTYRGGGLSGVVVVEGSDGKTVDAQLSELRIYARVESGEPDFMGVYPTPINVDGSFRLSGLRPGIAHVAFSSMGRVTGKQFGIVRVERNGVMQPDGIELKKGEHVAGIRVVLKYLTGAIRGIVKVEKGELPPSAQISMWLTPIDSGSARSEMTSISAPVVDSRGRFLIQGLPAATYEVNVLATSRGLSSHAKQQVIVMDNVVTEVTITIELKPNPGPGNP